MNWQDVINGSRKWEDLSPQEIKLLQEQMKKQVYESEKARYLANNPK